MNSINKNIFKSYETVETALLNDLATEARTKGKKTRTVKGDGYYVKYDGVKYDITNEQCRIYRLIRNNYNKFVEHLNSAKSDILGVWKNVWGDRLPVIIAEMERGLEICQKYLDAYKSYITEGDEVTSEETVETVEKNEETVVDEKDEEKNEEAETVEKNEGTDNVTSVVEYKLIKGYPDYMVSSDGKVWSLDYNHTGKMKELRPATNNHGYMYVLLCTNGQPVHKYIHRLVAEAFVANPDNKPEVNHKDEVKTNNCDSNLEWCNRNYNNNYGTHNDRVAKALTNHKDLSVPVVCLETGEVYPSAREASRQTCIDRGNISSCCNGKLKTAGGFHWAKFVEGDNQIYD